MVSAEVSTEELRVTGDVHSSEYRREQHHKELPLRQFLKKIVQGYIPAETGTPFADSSIGNTLQNPFSAPALVQDVTTLAI